MFNRGNSFTINTSAIDRMSKKFSNRMIQYDKVMKQRTTLVTNMVWRVAHQKRPIISKKVMKATGRSYRVSDPTAKLGVPVRTGTLQGSIQQSVTREGTAFVGKIWTKGIPYAGYMEYGTSRIAPRPYMRPAIAVNEESIKRMFRLKIESNV